MAAQPYSVRLAPDAARALVHKGGAIVLLDVPPGTAIGIDAQIFVTGLSFCGVKMVPPGVHAVSYALSSSSQSSSSSPGSPPPTSFGPPTVFFVVAAAGEATVRRMDMTTETLVSVDEETARAYARGVATRPDLDARLAPYDLSSLAAWRALSSHLDADVVRRIAPVGGDVCGAEEGEAFEGDGKGGRTDAEKALDRSLQEAREKRRTRTEGTGGEAKGPPLAAENVVGLEEDGTRQITASSKSDLDPSRSKAALGAEPDAVAATPPGVSPSPSSAATPPGFSPSPSSAATHTGFSPSPSSAATHTGSSPSPSSAVPHRAPRCFFTPLPRVVRPASSSPAALTLANMDKSVALRELVAKAYRGDPGALIGELQFAFLAFLLGHSAAAFAQWRAMTSLLLSSPDAAAQDDPKGLFQDALDALLAQLALADATPTKNAAASQGAASASRGGSELSADAPGAAALSSAALFSEIEDDTELRKLARRFLAALEEDRAPPDVRRRARALAQALGGGPVERPVVRRGDEDEGEEEEDEDGPTIVDAADLPEGYLDGLV